MAIRVWEYFRMMMEYLMFEAEDFLRLATSWNKCA
jgi:hypothetical protein